MQWHALLCRALSCRAVSRCVGQGMARRAKVVYWVVMCMYGCRCFSVNLSMYVCACVRVRMRVRPSGMQCNAAQCKVIVRSCSVMCYIAV